MLQAVNEVSSNLQYLQNSSVYVMAFKYCYAVLLLTLLLLTIKSEWVVIAIYLKRGLHKFLQRLIFFQCLFST